MVSVAEHIAQQLTTDGWVLDYTVLDRGGLNKSSRFSVTVTHKGGSFTTEYHNGLRTWKKQGGLVFLGWPTGGYYWEKAIRRGKPVNLNLVGDNKCHPLRLKEPAQCKPEQRAHQQEIFTAFENLTDPVTPTIDEVLCSLLLDAEYVRYGQTFEEFCSSLCYDTDSRNAERSFNASRDAWAALVRMHADFDALTEMFQNY